METPLALIKTYLSQRKILIIDAHPLTRNRLSKLFVGLGSNVNQLYLASSHEEARKLMLNELPEVIVTDYLFHKGNALLLAHEFNQIKSYSAIFTILTENSLQSTVSEAAEEDVDLYILKPYTTDYFIKAFHRAIMSKMNPSDYVMKINGGKRFLDHGLSDEAIQWFNHAIAMSPKPSLAFYYRSRAELQKRLEAMAEESLRAGLRYSEVHYKCLTGLFDLLVSMGKNKDAYEMVRKLSAFPLTSDRLTKVIELAMKTANYSDIDQYFDAYQDIQVPDPELSKHMSAALVISGKILFQRGEMYKAASFLKKASQSAAQKPNLLLEIVTTLAFNRFIPNAKKTLELFPNEARNGFQYKIASAMIAYCEDPGSNQHLALLQDAIAGGVSEPETFYWLIAFLEASKRKRQVEEVLNQAQSLWPEKMEYFERARHAIPQKI